MLEKEHVRIISYKSRTCNMKDVLEKWVIARIIKLIKAKTCMKMVPITRKVVTKLHELEFQCSNKQLFLDFSK